MGLKSLLKRLGLICLNFLIIYIMWLIGWKAMLGFIVGVFVGACIILWWAMTKNNFLSGLFQKVWSDIDVGGKKGGKEKIE